jgi:PPP family 3-phenylpropionic acid transporter
VSTTHIASGGPREYLLLRAQWFFAVGALGIHFPYFALLLRENAGLSATQVGLVLAIQPLVGLFAQPAWGQIADRSGSRVRVLVALCVGTALGYVALGNAHGLAQVALATFVFALFGSAVFPVAISVTFGALVDPRRFGRVRVWGTLGYFIVVVGAPPLLSALRAARGLGVVQGGPSEPGLEWMFELAGGLMLAAAMVALGLREEGASSQRAQRGDLRVLLSTPAFLRALAFVAGAQFFLNGPMQLFPLYVRARGGSMSDVSHMWIVMLLCEVPLILHSERLFARFSVTGVMAAATACGGLRWLLTAWAPSLAWAYPVQLVHGLVVTGLGVGTALHVQQIVPSRLRSTAQAFVALLGSSIGGALSSVLCGAAVDRVGVTPVFISCGLGGFVWAVAFFRPLVMGEAAASRTS